MADLAGMLSQIMSSEEGRQQVNQVLSALGAASNNETGQGQNNGQSQNQNQSSGGGLDLSGLMGMLQNSGSQNNSQSQNQSSGGGLDLSGLMGMLQNSGGQNNGQSQSQSQNQSSGGGLDLSGLMGMLQNSGGQNNSQSQNQNQNSGGGLDLSGLMGMLQNNGGQSGSQSGNSGLPNLDFGKLLRIQQLLSQSHSDNSAQLLRALKPHLSEKSAKKVDEAVRILQLLNLLPLLKESGLFGSLLGGEGL